MINPDRNKDKLSHTAAEMREIADRINAATRDTVENTRVNGFVLDIFARKKPNS